MVITQQQTVIIGLYGLGLQGEPAGLEARVGTRIQIHDQVLWHHVPRGGYSFTEHVRAQVIGITEKRIALLVTTRKPDRQKVVHVKPTRVYHEGERCPGCEIIIVPPGPTYQTNDPIVPVDFAPSATGPAILPPPCGPLPDPKPRRKAVSRG